MKDRGIMEEVRKALNGYGVPFREEPANHGTKVYFKLPNGEDYQFQVEAITPQDHRAVANTVARIHRLMQTEDLSVAVHNRGLINIGIPAKMAKRVGITKDSRYDVSGGINGITLRITDNGPLKFAKTQSTRSLNAKVSGSRLPTITKDKQAAIRVRAVLRDGMISIGALPPRFAVKPGNISDGLPVGVKPLLPREPQPAPKANGADKPFDQNDLAEMVRMLNVTVKQMKKDGKGVRLELNEESGELNCWVKL